MIDQNLYMSLRMQKSGFTALIAAATNGRFDCVRVLLKGARGADKNAKDPDRVRGMRIRMHAHMLYNSLQLVLYTIDII